METDILVIGGGIVGTAIVRELSKYKARVLLIEKEVDVAFGSPTRANTAIIHAGYDDKPGTLASRLCPRGNWLWQRIALELGIPYRRIGSLVVALADEETPILERLLARGRKNRVPELAIIDSRRLREMEPSLNPDALAALCAPTAGIICPYEGAIALSENARENGVSILLGTEALDIVVKCGEMKGVTTKKGTIEAEYLINAAGLFADEISSKVGICDFKIVPRKGEYIVYDKELDGLVNHVLFPMPTHVSKGIVVTPTVDKNLLVGPNARDVESKMDTEVTSSGMREVLDGACKLVPSLSKRRGAVITSFAGLRPEPDTGDFIIRPYEEPRGLINVAGVRSPGLTSAPAIAEMVVDILKKEGLQLDEKDRFNPFRKPIEHPIRDFHPSKAASIISRDSRYGHVVCRCEQVTEGEIVDAIGRGATTLDGVKYRTRAGMGRCQGGFCTPHVTRILSRELGIPVEDVTKKGSGSEILLYPSKELLVGDLERWKGKK